MTNYALFELRLDLVFVKETYDILEIVIISNEIFHNSSHYVDVDAYDKYPNKLN